MKRKVTQLLESLSRAAVLALPLLFACGGGGGGGGSGSGGTSAATLDLLIGDAPVDGLSVFEVTVAGVFLIRDDATETSNLLSAPRSFDLLSLREQSALLEVTSAAATTYRGGRVAFDPASVSARDRSGIPVPVRMVGSGAVADFLQPVNASASDTLRLHFDVELSNSLAADPTAPGGLVFRPTLRLERRSGQSEPLDEVHGFVAAVQAAQGEFVLVLRDLDTGGQFGRMVVSTSASTVFFRSNASLISALEFYAAASGRRVEAHGALLADGRFAARLVKLEDGDDGLVHIKGVITGLDLSTASLQLRVGEIVKGRELAGPVLAGLGSPGEIPVTIDQAVILVEGASPRPGGFADLSVGLKIKVKFADFSAPPFPARFVEVDDERIEFEGTIVDDSGAPDLFVLRLEPHDPAVLSGRVDSSSTPVELRLQGGEQIFLDVRQASALSASQLQTGLRVKVYGDISGPSSGPSLQAARVKVRPGRLDGEVQTGDQSLGTFTVALHGVDDPFGGSGPASPATVRFAANSQVEDDASSPAGFFALLSGLRSGEFLEVRVEGITGNSGVIEAHTVEVRKRK